MKCSEIIRILRELAPEEYACDWDNPGLLAGHMEGEVKQVYIAFDATDTVIEDAVLNGADLLITHHPLIFKGVKQVTDQNFITRRVVRMLEARLACYAMHTNFDAAPGCMADLAAGRLGICDGVPLEVLGEAEGVPYGIGKAGTLQQPVSVEQLARQVKEAFGLPYVLVYGQKQLTDPLTRAAVCPGSGGSEIENALKLKAQVLVAGDISHHQALDAVARGMAVIDAGHYGLEHIFIDFIDQYLEKKLGEQVKRKKASPEWPAAVL